MGEKYGIAQRVQALTLLNIGMTIEDVRHITRFLQNALFDLKKCAKERGYDSTVNPVIHDMYVKNAYKSGRSGISLEKQSEIIAKITIDCYRQEKSTVKIAGEVEISQSPYTEKIGL